MRNMGEYLKDAKYAVEDAINSGDYRELSNRLGDLAGDAIHEFNRATGSFCGTRHQFDQDEPPFTGQGQGNGQPGQDGQPGWPHNRFRQPGMRTRNYRTYGTDSYSGSAHVRMPRVKIKGKVSSIVYSIFGWIGTLGFGITSFVLGCVFLGLGMNSSVLKTLIIVFSIVTAGSLVMLRKGTKQRHFISRYQVYQSLLSKTKACEIKRMAEYVNKPVNFVVKDLQKMMSYNMFIEAHFDEKKTCFMVGDETYQLYMEAEKNFRERQTEQEAQKAQQKDKVVNEELEKAIREGRTYIQQLRKANDDIPGEEISRKLDRLEMVISKIFVCVEKHPEKLSEIRKFMDYYLPITIKLVNAYKEFDSQTIQGETVKNSKLEIENTLDTIDLAFEKLLDSLYEDEAMEVSSDISVLNALFAQEGLTKNDFDLKK